MRRGKKRLPKTIRVPVSGGRYKTVAFPISPRVAQRLVDGSENERDYLMNRVLDLYTFQEGGPFDA